MLANSPIRVRFAPSPTGHLHIGSFRTALFNWLFARHYKGIFLVRIEDTDQERSKKEYVESIMGALDWVGLKSDEPVVVQSSRSKEHEDALQKLLQEKRAYKCFCSQEDVAKRSGDTAFSSYDGKCRTVDQSAPGAYVIRFKIPQVENVSFNDLIRGTITIPRDQLDDFIIARSDGSATYNFVVVVDDNDMNITHVIRGEDHISNTPKQVLLYQACGFTVPEFAHIPLILGPSGDRLSKRDGAVSALEYKKLGYLPTALMNYLVRLGWSHGDQEIFTRQELIKFFTLDAVGKKGSIFDIEKLNWLNGVYLRTFLAQDILTYIAQELSPGFQQDIADWSQDLRVQAIDLFKERSVTLVALMNEVKILYDGPSSYQEADLKKWTDAQTIELITELIAVLQKKPTIDVAALKIEVKSLAQKHDVKLVKIAQPVRIALIGSSTGPGVFDMVSIIGIPQTMNRLSKLIEAIKK